MANTGKNSPLGINVVGDYMYNVGFNINPIAASYMGTSKRNASYLFGSCVNDTCLRLLTWAINDAYNRGVVLQTPAGSSVYDSIISIGASTIPGLGNSMPLTYVPVDPSNVWARTSVSATVLSLAEQYGRLTGYNDALPGPATSGFGNYDGFRGDPLQGYGVTDQKQNATWYPYNMSNPNHSITQWGYIRLHALQAWNEYNWNGLVVDPDSNLPVYLEGVQVPEYKEFLSSIGTSDSYVTQNNQSIIATANANTFLDGTYSNMNDLISADITGVSLSTGNLGIDLENLGMAIDLSRIDSFGLPSNLLRTLGMQGAISQDLSLVLLASGLSSTDISEITEGVNLNPTQQQERQIYSAFLMMSGENLNAIISPIQCKTQGLQTLADLLDVQKLFPNSFSTLTVPMYNSEPGPTNSKTYYLLYTSGSINPALSSPAMREYVGTLVPNGVPPIFETSTSPKNYRDIPQGFDSYLQGILPTSQAVAAGALSFTLRQIRNIENFDIAQFAKVVKGIENVSNLPLVSGTSKPTNQNMINQSTHRGALGSGPFGSFTMSDLFGSMSGLPYPWKLVQERISQLETVKLYNIYRELFLAVTWEAATVTVVPEVRVVEISPGVFQTEYRVGSLVINDSGGGYGRGNAPDPVITCSNGGSGTGLVGRDDALAGSVGAGTFGRVNSATVTNSGAWQLTVPTASVQCPPTGGLPIDSGGNIATGGNNTAAGTVGWALPMNQVVQSYIQQANEEISNILIQNPTIANYLNTYWNNMGSQLMIEHRTRYQAFPPVVSPKEMFTNTFSTTIYGFVDSIPQLAQDTKPHMSAQTLEAISDLNTVGGQSAVGMMRQERNQARLQLLGIEQDNNIPTALSENEIKQLTTNGTLPNAIMGTGIASCNPEVEFTLPAWSTNVVANKEVTPVPGGVYVPTTSTDPNLSAGFNASDQTNLGDITSILECHPYPTVGPLVPIGPTVNSDVISFPVIIQPAAEFDPNNLPPNLDPKYTNSTLLPAVPSVQEAIDNVTECNCDCWIS
jgi:hypothetical protein